MAETWEEWLALSLTPGIGITSYHRLLSRFGNPGAVLRAPATEIAACAGINRKQTELVGEYFRTGDYRREIEKVKKSGIRVVTLHDMLYPERLREIYQPPPLLYLKGNFVEGDNAAIAIVGTRQPTAYGLSVAGSLAGDLARAGVTVVSGLARGIDQAAHASALKAGGRTIAVLGTGLDMIYPSHSEHLCKSIMSHGCLISEFPLATPPHKGNFPRRNRVISGMTLGVVVIEAPQKSGALITANYALEQGREVFAVPGRITSRASQGSNRLIKEGAKLVENVDDVLSEFSLFIDRKIVRPLSNESLQPAHFGKESQQLFSLLSDDPVHIDILQRLSGFPVSQITAILLRLEMAGLVVQMPGKFFIQTFSG